MKGHESEEEDPKCLLITIDEAATRLSIGRSHIYEQMRRGSLRSVHIGRSRRILEGDLDAFIGQLLESGDLARGRTASVTRRPVKAALPSRPGRR